MLTSVLLLALLCGTASGTDSPAPGFAPTPAPTPASTFEGTNGHPTFNPYTPAPTPVGTNGGPTFHPDTPAPTPLGSNGHPTFNPYIFTPEPTPETTLGGPTFNPYTLPPTVPLTPEPTPETTLGGPTFNPYTLPPTMPLTPEPTPETTLGGPTFNPYTLPPTLPFTPRPTPGELAAPTFNPSTLPPTPTGGSSPCFDPDSPESVVVDTHLGGIRMRFSGCNISNGDLEDVAALFDELGRAEITVVHLSSGTITTLPEGFFQGFENLLYLDLGSNDIVSLPAGIFDGLPAMYRLILNANKLTNLTGEFLTEGLSGLETLDFQRNELVTIEAGAFDALTGLIALNLFDTSLVSLPLGLFDELHDLELLQISLNWDLLCIPDTDAVIDWFESTSTDDCACTQAEQDACGEGFTCNLTATVHDCEGGYATSPPTVTPVQTCSNGIEGIDANGVVCCPVGCGACAGSGCASRPGGSSECCGGAIKSSGVYCDDSGAAPCIIGSASPVETCSNGIEGIDANGVVCCPLSCGACAGSGCASRPGGSNECCGGGIKSTGVYCDDSGAAPCII